METKTAAAPNPARYFRLSKEMVTTQWTRERRTSVRVRQAAARAPKRMVELGEAVSLGEQRQLLLREFEGVTNLKKASTPVIPAPTQNISETCAEASDHLTRLGSSSSLAGLALTICLSLLFAWLLSAPPQTSLWTSTSAVPSRKVEASTASEKNLCC